MRLCLLSVSVIIGVLECAAEYVPGTPGAKWSRADVLIVKAKLSRLFDVEQSVGIVNEYAALHPSEVRPEIVQRPVAVVLRLGFHDCLRYIDGAGGCDGCLNFDGFLGNFEGPWYQLQLNKTDIAFNNGLQHIVKILEEIYINAFFSVGNAIFASVVEEWRQI